MTAQLVINHKVSGRYRVEKFRGDECTFRSPWCKNLITNGGLDRMGDNSDWLQYCQVGTDNTAPANTDTALGGYIAGTQTTSSSTSAISASPRTVTRTKIFTFSEGAAEGNLAELGVGWASTGSLFSRALILDGVGSPTTVTVLADETLRVTYEFTMYIPTVDTTGTVTLDSVSYDWTGRAANAETNDGNNWDVGTNGTTAAQIQVNSGGTSKAYDGAIGAITAEPSGTSSLITSQTFDAYVSTTYERSCELVWNFDQANFVAGAGTGVGAISFKTGIGRYQIGFVPKIPKTDSQTLKLTVKHSWSRYVA